MFVSVDSLRYIQGVPIEKNRTILKSLFWTTTYNYASFLTFVFVLLVFRVIVFTRALYSCVCSYLDIFLA